MPLKWQQSRELVSHYTGSMVERESPLYWQNGGKGEPTPLAAWWEGRAHYTCTVVGREGGSHSTGSVAARLPLYQQCESKGPKLQTARLAVGVPFF